MNWSTWARMSIQGTSPKKWITSVVVVKLSTKGEGLGNFPQWQVDGNMDRSYPLKPKRKPPDRDTDLGGNLSRKDRSRPSTNNSECSGLSKFSLTESVMDVKVPRETNHKVRVDRAAPKDQDVSMFRIENPVA
jgi:hypothetical protein